MSAFDDFWDAVVDHGLMGPDQAGRARTRHAQHGGGLDTAVIEIAALDEKQRRFMVEAAARAVGLPVARSEFIDAPDLEALARLPRSLVSTFGIIPSRELGGRSVLVVPALLPHQLNQIRATATGFRLYVGCEVDIWEALGRFAGIPSPARIEAVWTGRCPSVMSTEEFEGCGPIAMPRSTHLEFEQYNPGSVSRSAEGEFDGVLSVSKPSNTRPGRPQALGLADTADFEEQRHQANLRHHSAMSDCVHTADDNTVLTSICDDENDLSEDHLSMSGEFSSCDTVPPAAQ